METRSSRRWWTNAPRTSPRRRSRSIAASRQCEGKRALENYCFTVRSALRQEAPEVKFEDGDQGEIEKAVRDTLGWLDENQFAP